MKKVFCNNIVAKILLCMSSCHTITIGPFVLSKRSEERITPAIRNHEFIHVCQWREMTDVSLLIIFLFMLFARISPWWIFSSVTTFYIWYGVEYLVRAMICNDTDRAYKSVSFEQESYENEDDPDYQEERKAFAWIKYL